MAFTLKMFNNGTSPNRHRPLDEQPGELLGHIPPRRPKP